MILTLSSTVVGVATTPSVTQNRIVLLCMVLQKCSVAIYKCTQLKLLIRGSAAISLSSIHPSPSKTKTCKQNGYAP